MALALFSVLLLVLLPMINVKNLRLDNRKPKYRNTTMLSTQIQIVRVEIVVYSAAVQIVLRLMIMKRSCIKSRNG